MYAELASGERGKEGGAGQGRDVILLFHMESCQTARERRRAEEGLSFLHLNRNPHLICTNHHVIKD